MRARFAVLAVALLSPLPSAVAAPPRVVVPNVHETLEGALDNAYPYRFTAGAGRYQQAFAASQFPGPIVIGEIAYRYLHDEPNGKAPADFKMTLSYSASPWDALSPTFGANVGPGATVVFDGVWTIKKFSGDPLTPNRFAQRLVLTKTFLYDPSLGDLLMDVEMRSSAFPLGVGTGAFEATGTAPGVGRVFANDGNPTSPVGVFVKTGLVTEFTASGVLEVGSGCPGSQPSAPELGWFGAPLPGAQVSLLLSNGLGGAASVTLVGAGAASVPIGDGCDLLVSPPVLPLLVPLGGSGPGAGTYSLPAVIPPTAPSGTIRMQAFVADPGGPIGLSATQGLAITIGP